MGWVLVNSVLSIVMFTYAGRNIDNGNIWLALLDLGIAFINLTVAAFRLNSEWKNR